MIGFGQVEVRVGKLMNGKPADNDESGEMIKGGGDGGRLDLEPVLIWPLRVVLCLKIGDLL